MTDAYNLLNIRYQYGSKTVLALDSLNIHAGKKTALIGANGSGKSTLLNLLAFLSTAQQGQLFFFGQPVINKERVNNRRKTGLLAQKAYMLRGTVEENLQLALKFQHINKSVWQTKINHALSSLGIEHIQHQAAQKLSGGELQKAALARILVCEPKVLLLDEPFSFLDQNSAQILENFINQYVLNTGTSVIFSTHNRLQGIAIADHVISLAEGKSVNTPLINIFHGQVEKHRFNTGKLCIQLTSDITSGKHISIDPAEIVISKQPISSSIRNSYQGRITHICEEMGHVRLSIVSTETFQALITYQAFKDLQLHLGDSAWVNFKSNAVVVF